MTEAEVKAKCEVLAPCGDAMAIVVLNIIRERDELREWRREMALDSKFERDRD